MDIQKFNTEIGDRLGGTMTSIILKKAFTTEKTLLDSAREIRLRTNMPLCITLAGKIKNVFLGRNGSFVSEKESYIISKEEIDKIFSGICQNSLYAYKEDVKNGFITLKGGHRVGIAGKMLPDGSIYDVSAMNIRISRQVRGCSKNIINHIIKNENEIYNTLIISPPACGKTTIIRDLARILGQKSNMFSGACIGIIDERSEIAACYNGAPSNDVGIMTDIYDACPKEKGIIMMIRSMAPEIIITDEIGSKGDAAAVASAINAGVKIIATAHGNNIADVKARREISEIIASGVFEKFIILNSKKGPGTIEQILKA